MFILFILPMLGLTFQSCSGDKHTEQGVFSRSYRTWVETLSSPEFEGRAPATPGGKKSEDYIEKEFRRIGLLPANGNSYRQTVPLVEITGTQFSNLKITDRNSNVLEYAYRKDMVVGTYLQTNQIRLENSELVFAGFGIVAPEYSWNDYEGLDVKGKTVVVIINDPGYFTHDESMFTGKAMTYYGRWTYKYEEAERQGAAGLLIIHETGAASYGWEVVRNSWSGPQYMLGGESEYSSLQVQGWIKQEVAETLFKSAGTTYEKVREMALKPGFKPFSMNMTASVSFEVEYQESESDNIIGYIKGRKYPEETIIYMAHWDHLGIVETPEGRGIYHGAVDNATGVAALKAIAEKFLKTKPAPERSVVLMAVTAEESGLLGSRFYSNNPLFPLEKTAGGINMDGLKTYGKTNDVSVVGYNSSELQNYLRQHADNQGRILIPDKYPERGSFYRSDHFNLVRKGVPMIYANSGEDYIGRDEDYAPMVKKDMEGRYHTPDDVVHELWDWTGIDQNLWLFFHVGKELANSRDWPEWSEGSEFITTRDISRNLRK